MNAISIQTKGASIGSASSPLDEMHYRYCQLPMTRSEGNAFDISLGVSDDYVLIVRKCDRQNHYIFL